ncbi:MAG: acyloxyacyl hydrolase [Litorimonas sp.]
MKQFLLGLAVAFGLCAPAFAQVSEVRVGANIHDIDWTGLGSGSDKERSVAINAEIIFEEPEFLRWALTPQPYVGGAVNLEGETSYGGAGLLWRQTFGEGLFFDYQFGLVVHNGTLEAQPSSLLQSVIDGRNPNTFSTPEQQQFAADLAEFRFRQQNEIDFGSRILFQNQFSLGYRFSEKWSASIFANHLSHGKILAPNAPNEGLDTIGFRLGHHF